MCAGPAGCDTAAAWLQHGWLLAPRYTGPQFSHLQQGAKAVPKDAQILCRPRTGYVIT